MRRYCPGSRTRCPLKAHLFWTLKYRLSVASCTIPDDITNTQEREPVGDDGRFQSTPFEPLAFQARVVQCAISFFQGWPWRAEWPEPPRPPLHWPPARSSGESNRK